jgi:hypothetical protein
MQFDKHVVKMIVESAQMLSTAHRVLDGEKVVAKRNGRKYTTFQHPTLDDVLYKSVHVNHPCTQWTIETSENYLWHYDHFVALAEEYTYRYGKTHRSFTLLKEHLRNLPENISVGQRTQFRLAMKSHPECMDENDPVTSYRKFYCTKKERISPIVWTIRSVPIWYS